MLSERVIATDVASRLRERGFRAYFVGGCVRDKILGQEPGDHDVATDAPLTVVEEVLCPISEGPPECGSNYPVRKFKIGGYKIDVTSMKNGSLLDDTMRRDFTMNAMFEDPIAGGYIDLLNGRKDMAEGLLRGVGDVEEHMVDDTRRMIRAPRFASKLSYRIDAPIWRATQRLAHLVRDIKAEWLVKECQSLMAGAKPALGLNFIVETGLVNHLPEEALDVLRLTGGKSVIPIRTTGPVQGWTKRLEFA
ncbi:MAG: hypothetical protein K2X93_08010 [Candidatus Obscuribacterales bacterium]|nr:hypothetical protein [Candidatus Obscuribacterales bacterium]